jgi:peptidoglycan/xylan/chitin deacetylase (PgdA/CDA1 family)
MHAWHGKTLNLLLSCAVVSAAACGGGTTSNPGVDGGGDDDDVMTDGGFGPDAPPGNQDCVNGFGAWDGHDNVPASQSAPCAIAVDKTPMFVSIGWDDNGDAEGMTWALDMLKQRNVHASFYLTSTYGSSQAVLDTWKRAKAEGHELGNHTVTHLPAHGGHDFTVDQWQTEINGCTDFLTGSAAVMQKSEMFGFRTPYLEYDDNMFSAVQTDGFWYDCSIEEGYEDGHDGSTEFFPYTLDNKSPGHTVQVEWMDPTNPIKEITPHPGLWEMPLYAVFTPPDSKCAEYGIPTGFRARLKAAVDWFDPESGSITGFDYNLWATYADGGFQFTPAEYLATMKYTFDQRLNGNHAPLLFGSHTPFYVDSWSVNSPGAPLAADRRKAVEDFVDYMISKGAVITTHKAILDWMRAPKALP